MLTRFDPSPRDSTSTPSPRAFGLALVQAGGGDASLVAVLRQMAWESYLAAGAPGGRSEEAMAAWWDARLAAHQN